MDQKSSSKPLVMAGAVYDLVAVGPLAIPVIASAHLEILFLLNELLGFSSVLPRFVPVQMLFVNLFGVVALLWIYCRLFQFDEYYYKIDFCLRASIACLLIYYLVSEEVPGLVWVFLGIEFFWATAYFMLILRQRRLMPRGQAGH